MTICKMKYVFVSVPESILVMSSVGVQMKIVRMFGQKSAKFYDIQQIDDVVINEAITMVY